MNIYIELCQIENEKKNKKQNTHHDCKYEIKIIIVVCTLDQIN